MMEISKDMRESIVKMIKEQYKDYDYRKERYNLIPNPDWDIPENAEVDFFSANQLGKGAFGQVYEVRDKESGEVLALKRILIKYDFDYTDPSVTHTSKSDRRRILSFVQYCQEAVLQSETFSHPNIVKVKDKWIQHQSSEPEKEELVDAKYITDIVAALQSEGDFRLTPELRTALNNIRGLCVYMTMEKYDQSLRGWIGSSTQSQEDREDVIRQLIAALHYTHSEGYSHCDLRGDNILIKEDTGAQTIEAAIADFGLSELHVSKLSADATGNETQIYCRKQKDILSFGQIVYEVIKQKSSSVKYFELQGVSPAEAKLLVEQNTGNVSMAEIVIQCLEPDEDRRVTANQLYEQYVNTVIETPLMDAL